MSNAQEQLSSHHTKSQSVEIIAHEIITTTEKSRQAETGRNSGRIALTTPASSHNLSKQASVVTEGNLILVKNEIIVSHIEVNNERKDAVRQDSTATSNESSLVLPTSMSLLDSTSAHVNSVDQSTATHHSAILNHRVTDKSSLSNQHSRRSDEFDVSDESDDFELDSKLQTIVVPQIEDFAEDFDVTGKSTTIQPTIKLCSLFTVPVVITIRYKTLYSFTVHRVHNAATCQRQRRRPMHYLKLTL